MNEYFEHRRRMLIDSVSGGFRLPFTYYDWKATPTGFELVKMFNPQVTTLIDTSNVGIIAPSDFVVRVRLPWDNSDGTYNDMKKELRNFSEIVVVAQNYQGIRCAYEVYNFSNKMITYSNDMNHNDHSEATFHIPKTALGSDYDPSYGIQLFVSTYNPREDAGAQIHKIIIK